MVAVKTLLAAPGYMVRIPPAAGSAVRLPAVRLLLAAKVDLMDEVLRARLEWKKTGPGQWESVLNEKRCRLTMNDFPDEPLYTVLVDEELMDIDDVPPGWHIE